MDTDIAGCKMDSNDLSLLTQVPVLSLTSTERTGVVVLMKAAGLQSSEEKQRTDERSFRLLDQPPEIWSYICKLAVTVDCTIKVQRYSSFSYCKLSAEVCLELAMHAWMHARTHGPEEEQQCVQRTKEHLSQDHQPPITRVCRAIRAEALPHFYAVNTFIIQRDFSLHPPEHCTWLCMIGANNVKRLIPHDLPRCGYGNPPFRAVWNSSVYEACRRRGEDPPALFDFMLRRVAVDDDAFWFNLFGPASTLTNVTELSKSQSTQEKPFRLLTLPPELWSRICKLAATFERSINVNKSIDRVYASFICEACEEAGTPIAELPKDFHPPPPKKSGIRRHLSHLCQPAITRVCRIIRAEVLPYYYGANCFIACVEDPWYATTWFRMIGAHNIKHLREAYAIDRDRNSSLDHKRPPSTTSWPTGSLYALHIHGEARRKGRLEYNVLFREIEIEDVPDFDEVFGKNSNGFGKLFEIVPRIGE